MTKVNVVKTPTQLLQMLHPIETISSIPMCRVTWES